MTSQGAYGWFRGEWVKLSSNNNILIENEVRFCAHVKRLLLFLQGAERKNKDESKSAEKRIQKWVKQNTSACAGECLSESFYFPCQCLIEL